MILHGRRIGRSIEPASASELLRGDAGFAAGRAPGPALQRLGKAEILEERLGLARLLGAVA
jgi:hypothetical protein